MFWIIDAIAGLVVGKWCGYTRAPGHFGESFITPGIELLQGTPYYILPSTEIEALHHQLSPQPSTEVAIAACTNFQRIYRSYLNSLRFSGQWFCIEGINPAVAPAGVSACFGRRLRDGVILTQVAGAVSNTVYDTILVGRCTCRMELQLPMSGFHLRVRQD